MCVCVLCKRAHRDYFCSRGVWGCAFVNTCKRGHTSKGTYKRGHTSKHGHTSKCGRPWFPVMSRGLQKHKMGAPLQGYGHYQCWIVSAKCV